MRTVEQAQKIIDAFEELQERAAPIASAMLELELNRPIAVDPEEITVEDGDLYATVEEYMGCSNYETYNRVIPLEYIFDPEWEKTALVKLAEQREFEKEQKRLAQEKSKRAKEDRERREYLKLKAKYGEKS